MAALARPHVQAAEDVIDHSGPGILIERLQCGDEFLDRFKFRIGVLSHGASFQAMHIFACLGDKTLHGAWYAPYAC